MLHLTTIKPQDPKENTYTSLYEGLFQEVFATQPTEQYGHIVYDTKTRQLCHLDTTAQEHERIDPVAFAYDFGARMYDARIGRWCVPYHYAESYLRYSVGKKHCFSP